MVSHSPAVLDRVFHALAHPARRAMLRRLAEGERNLTELAAPLRMTFPAASKHVRVLESAHLVRRHIHGRTHTCRLDIAPLGRVAEWAEECRKLWEGNFARLDSLLEEMKAVEGIESPAPSPAPALPRRRAVAARTSRKDHRRG